MVEAAGIESQRRALPCFAKSVFEPLKHWLQFAFSAFHFFNRQDVFGSRGEENLYPIVTKNRLP
jgi:hypothetical protein